MESTMSRLSKLGLLMFVAGALASPALADDDKNPRTAGHKGTVTAWNDAGDTVLDHKVCLRNKGSWDYVSCGNALRERLKDQICATAAPGLHKYLYQVGDGRKNPSTVLCKK
jgi:hypothetical protein